MAARSLTVWAAGVHASAQMEPVSLGADFLGWRVHIAHAGDYAEFHFRQAEPLSGAPSLQSAV